MTASVTSDSITDRKSAQFNIHAIGISHSRKVVSIRHLLFLLILGEVMVCSLFRSSPTSEIDTLGYTISLTVYYIPRGQDSNQFGWSYFVLRNSSALVSSRPTS